MKKKSIVLSILMIFCVLVSPLSVHAAGTGQVFASSATISDSMNLDNTTLDGRTFSITNSGTGTVQVYLGLRVDSGTLNNYQVDLKLGNSNYTFSGGRRSSSWTPGESGTGFTADENDPSIIHVDLQNTDGVGTGLHQVATITLAVDSSAAVDEECLITLSTPEDPEEPTTPENPTCTIVDGVYYDDNGVVVTEEEYNAACLNPENPQTGSFLPYAVIGGGIIVAIGLYMFTKKNKIYHI